MAAEPLHDDTVSSSRIDGHKLSEFIYGTIIGMVAVAGIDGGDGTSWLEAAAAIVAGAAAIWVAHAYAMLLSRRVVAGHRLAARDLGEALAGSWPIVTAGVILALPLLPAALGFWSLDYGLRAANVTGLVMLALMGVLAGVVTKETWPRRVLMAALSAGLGFAIVAVEFAVHH